MSKQQDTQKTDSKTETTSDLKSPQMLIVEELIKGGYINKDDPRLKSLFDRESQVIEKSIAMQKVLRVAREYTKRPDQLVEFLASCTGFVADAAIDQIMNDEQPNLSNDLQRLIGASLMYQSLITNVLKVVELASTDLQANISNVIENEAKNGNFTEKAQEIIKKGNPDLASVLNANKVQSNCCGGATVHSDAPKPPS